ncbi:MAG: hypothetical protein C0412_17200 [Flavobacterium sp.]|nr:hypothetical protein [Flavobacterium sp.]
MNRDITSIIFVVFVLVAIIYLFIKIAMRLRKHGGSMTTTMHVATYEFLSKDTRESVKEVVEMKTNKKLEEESSDKPIKDL